MGRPPHVRYLVEGSVRRGGSRVRIEVDLVKAADGFRVWGDDYDRSSSDLLALQEEIAGEVATNIAGQLAPGERRSIAERPTRNPEAYDHLLRGNYYMAQRSPGAVRRGIGEYETAVRLDPGLTRALGRIAWAYAIYGSWDWTWPGLPQDSLLQRQRLAIDRALRADSIAPEGRLALALYLFWRPHPAALDEIRSALERALALDSTNAEAWHALGWFLHDGLREDSAAIAHLKRALAIDPTRPITLETLARVLFRERRFEEADRWLDSALAVDPALFIAYAERARVRLALGDLAGARSDAETAERLGGRLAAGTASVALVEARAGDTVAARASLERYLGTATAAEYENPNWGPWVAVALIATGQRERALDLLERIRRPSGELWVQLSAPEFDPVRTEPRFQRVSAAANLARPR